MMKMKQKHFYHPISWVVALLIFSSLFTNIKVGSSQSIEPWSDPINLSQSGSSSDPILVVDSSNRYHVIWVDAFDGYQYAMSEDGRSWTSPEAMRFPFDVDDSQPVILADRRGYVHALWITRNRSLAYSFALANNFGIVNAWNVPLTLSVAVLNFDVAMDGLGGLHVGYITNGISQDFTEIDPAGVYYRQKQNLNSSWSEAQSIYLSKYYRSIPSQNAHISIFAGNDPVNRKIYLGWDDRSLKRIFFTRSENGGLNWSALQQIAGPELIQGIAMPFNIQVSAAEDKTLVLYQLGMPGDRCTQYSQWSVDGGLVWSTPVKVLEEFPLCPKISELIYQDNAYFVALFDIIDDLTFLAWNGSEWSEPQKYIELSAFQNSQTFDPIIYRCRQVTIPGQVILVVGCDEGGGGDIWFTSSMVRTFANWFPSRTRWSSPESFVETTARIYDLTVISGQDDNTYVFWVESLITEVDEIITIQHSSWNGSRWSIPNTIVSDLLEVPAQIKAINDERGRIILTWVDGEVGQLFFTWVSADRSSISSEWVQPTSLSETYKTISSPDILVDASGKILIVFAVPFNEKRGLYFIQSEDRGVTWSEPVQIFDAVSANWDLINNPKLSLSSNGRLHLLFTQYSVQGTPVRLLYTQSSDGGLTWGDMVEVTDQPVLWSEVITQGDEVVHLLWQEKAISLLANYHQISIDGGISWDHPVEVSFVRGISVSPSVIMDREGNLHFFQTVNPESLTLQYMKWDRTTWTIQESIRLRIDTQNFFQPVTIASTTPVGYLRAFISLDTEALSGEVVHQILTSRRFLELPVGEPELSNGVLPTSVVDSVATEEAEIVATPTIRSPLTGLSEPPPSLNRNLVGLIIVFVIILSTISAGVYVYIRNRSEDYVSVKD
jgi:hypothetical protein